MTFPNRRSVDIQGYGKVSIRPYMTTVNKQSAVLYAVENARTVFDARVILIWYLLNECTDMKEFQDGGNVDSEFVDQLFVNGVIGSVLTFGTLNKDYNEMVAEYQRLADPSVNVLNGILTSLNQSLEQVNNEVKTLSQKDYMSALEGATKELKTLVDERKEK
jgi:hypothetical protein